MTTATIRPANTTEDGWVRADSTVYATARGAANGTSSSQTNTTLLCGNRLNGSTYECLNTLFGFDVSVVPATAQVISVAFEYTMETAYNSAGYDLRIIDYNHGGTINTSDYTDGDAAAALANWGAIPKTNDQDETTYQVNLNAAGVAAAQAAVQAVVPFRFGIVSEDFIAGIVPTSAVRWIIHSSEQATSAKRPALIIDYSEAVGRRILTGRKLSRMRLWG